MIQVTDRELAVYQMHKNGYTKIEIADILKVSDDVIEWILVKNATHLKKLAKMDEFNERGTI